MLAIVVNSLQAARCRPSSISVLRRLTTFKKSSPEINSVIFDFDGVIVDTETIFYQINSESLAHFGVKYSMELKHGQMGRKLTEAVEYLLKHTELAEKGVKPEDYLAVYERLVDQHIPHCQLMPGARSLIEHLDRHNVQMAICTGSASDEFSKKVAPCRDLISKMSTIVLAGDDPDVSVGKPAPDAYLVTMSRMRPRPENPSSVLVFEDSINGVLSAKSAECEVIWVPQREFLMDGWQQLAKQMDVQVLDSLDQFKPEQYGLPALINRTTQK